MEGGALRTSTRGEVQHKAVIRFQDQTLVLAVASLAHLCDFALSVLYAAHFVYLESPRIDRESVKAGDERVKQIGVWALRRGQATGDREIENFKMEASRAETEKEQKAAALVDACAERWTKRWKLLDRLGIGFVSKENFLRTIRRGGVSAKPIGDEDAAFLYALLEKNKSGGVSILAFDTFIRNCAPKAAIAHAYKVVEAEHGTWVDGMNINIMRRKLRAGVQRESGAKWKEVFSRYDVDGGGTLSYHEFKRMMQRGGLLREKISDQEVDWLMNMLDAGEQLRVINCNV